MFLAQVMFYLCVAAELLVVDLFNFIPVSFMCDLCAVALEFVRLLVNNG